MLLKMNNENVSRRIFSKGIINIENRDVIQKVKYNREHILSKDTAYELNTYLNFGVFPTFADTAIPYYENGELKIDPSSKAGVGTPGVRSIFNRAGAVILGSSNGNYNVDITKGDSNNTHPWRIANNVPLMDSPEARRRIRKTSGCSIRELVTASQKGEMGQETYAYSDFMYCKHLGKVSNNYMITLRRFPLPVDDYIGARAEDGETRLDMAAKNAACIGCMITWMGVSGNDLSSILKYSYKMPFKSQDADEQDRKNDADSQQTLLNGLFSTFDPVYQQQYMDGYSSEAANKIFGYLNIKTDNKPYTSDQNPATFRDRNKVYGPVDSIRSTYIRSYEGLTFDQKLSLVFEYELRSYNGINPKQAMLDLISNILNVTYTTGTFWGGGFKGFAAHQSNIFANLEVFKKHNSFTGFMDAFFTDVGKGLGSLGNLSFNNIGSALNKIGGMLLASKLNLLGRPQKAMYNSLLSPAPIGFWHVTIGNPKRPIMTIGNMVITNVTVEHNGPLGLDDFPTGLKVTVELDRGKPRDLRDIEKLYMQGTDRIYSSMGDKVFDMYKNAELYKNARNSDPNSYKPVSNIATINNDPTNASKPTVTVSNYAKLNNDMLKYFGTTDTYSVYVPAAEQEYGAGKKKPSTKQNNNLAGANK
jgi:hypothetical protein